MSPFLNLSPDVREIHQEQVESSRQQSKNVELMEMLKVMREEMQERDRQLKIQLQLRDEYIEADLRRRDQYFDEVIRQRDLE